MATGSSGTLTKSANTWVSLQTFNGDIALPKIVSWTLPTTQSNSGVSVISVGSGATITTTTNATVLIQGTFSARNTVAAGGLIVIMLRTTPGNPVPSQGSNLTTPVLVLWQTLLTKMPTVNTDVVTSFSFLDGANGTLVSNGGNPSPLLNGVPDTLIQPNTTYTYFYAFGSNTSGTVSFEGADVSGAGTPATLIAMNV